MFFSYFTEQPYFPVPDEALTRYPDDHPARILGDVNLLLSNRFFDANRAQGLYEDRLSEYRFAEQVGFDGINLNEHHAVPWCLQARTNIMAAFVAANTTRVKIVQSENILPIWDNPVQLAEELAMIDILSGGRLVTGIFRGPGQDLLANNVNPAHNRGRFREAHDLLVKTWTEPGPFRWEGDHYQLRVVNPWVLPLQKPHPPIFVNVRSTAATAVFAATHGYPILGIHSTTEQDQRVDRIYAEAAAESGFSPGPEHRGYYIRISVAETEREALRVADQFIYIKDKAHNWGNPLWAAPTGYSTRDEVLSHRNTKGPRYLSSAEQVRAGTLFAGTPDQVVEQLGGWLESSRPSVLTLWAQDGGMTHEEALRNLRLLGEDVLPKIRAIGDRLGLRSQYD